MKKYAFAFVIILNSNLAQAFIDGVPTSAPAASQLPGPVACAAAAQITDGLEGVDISRLCAGATSRAPVDCAEAAAAQSLNKLDWATLCSGYK